MRVLGKRGFTHAFTIMNSLGMTRDISLWGPRWVCGSYLDPTFKGVDPVESLRMAQICSLLSFTPWPDRAWVYTTCLIYRRSLDTKENLKLTAKSPEGPSTAMQQGSGVAWEGKGVTERTSVLLEFLCLTQVLILPVHCTAASASLSPSAICKCHFSANQRSVFLPGDAALKG